MKKGTILTFSACAALFISSCQKQVDSTKPAAPVKSYTTVARLAPSSLADQIKVNSYGFLNLQDSNAFMAYVNFLDSNNATDIASFHRIIGFTNQTTVSGQAGNYISSATENAEYLFDANGVVQIGNLILRGMNTDGYLLVMPAASLNDNTYASLAAKTFDATKMCKLRVGDDYGDDIETYVKNNIGHDGTNDPVPSGGPGPSARWVHYHSSAGGHTIDQDDYYLFGIRWQHHICIDCNP